ncbi:hypothetical protein Herbaro_08735 [Herbaspirillum sp. WKF16]|uniref:hypothetical protein n=1 Tax=Herbaspirillum sp. WKF16 TaxID=3028312 RepID=UPI0023A95EDE|nr:hypothetical protein [Herbaspirillum sp. WKF16]WDZ97852.1 hypothetical protein Herbaro_08735 [Herbaspirillum sp. WKF16]
MVIELIQSLASPHYEAVCTPLKMTRSNADAVGAPPSRQGKPAGTNLAGIKKRRKMNLRQRKLIAPLFSKNSKLNE